MKRVHLLISGRVQGVFFRHNTNRLGNRLGLTGFVRNLSNGKVEVIAQGPENQLNKLIAFCKTGPSGAYVEDVEIQYEETTQEFNSFSIF